MPEVIGDVWKLETDRQEIASEDLDFLCQKALKGVRKARAYVVSIFEESWAEIKAKLKTEGSVWVVWWMDGVNKHLKNTY